MGKAGVRGPKSSKRAQELAELTDLETRCSQAPDPEWRFFDQLPLSQTTKKGLQGAGYVTMTEIQRETLPKALAGNDVLGAAKTGSGKTLAFVVPVLDRLYRLKWCEAFGVGALIITPTRELAYQCFEVLRKVGRYHAISAGLIIGGKDLTIERKLIARMNIIVATPGRLQQHLEETPDFRCDDLQILVLDEADRTLDMGFKPSLDAVLEALPTTRQTLLFSATQTRSVADLARLSLKDPEYVGVHDKTEHSTPTGLVQSYIVCPLPEKLSQLFSFLRAHSNDKVLVFVSSCKQVRFIHTAMSKLRPGLPLLALYGKQKQLKRMAVYNDFCRKQSACLIATDIAARGLDIPMVSWVIQLDCPEDPATYIHRVGRTARYERGGKSLLFLLPSEEEAMVAALKANRIPITAIAINPKKAVSITQQLRSFCAQDSELRYLAQRCFVSYVRSIYLQRNKDVFDVSALPLTEFSASLGLATAPKVRFVKKAQKIRGPIDEKVKATIESDSDESSQSDTELFTKRPTPLGETNNDWPLDTEETVSANQKVSRVALAKREAKKKAARPKKTIFNEDMTAIEQPEVKTESESDAQDGIDIDAVRKRLREEDKADRQAERQRIKEQHRARRKKMREARQQSSAGQSAVVLGGPVEDDGSE